MIKHLYIKNFKSLKETDLELRNLNLLTGLNGSGKSSLIQTLLLLRQSQSEIGQGKLLLSKKERELFDAGVAEDVYYQFGIDKEITIRLLLEKGETLNWRFDCDVLLNPAANILLSTTNYEEKTLQQSALFTEGFQYLNAQRLSPKNIYRRNGSVVEGNKSIGVYGEYVAHFLEVFGEEFLIQHKALQHPKAKSDKLIHQADAWLSEISPNVSLKTEKISNEETRLSYQFSTGRGKTNKFKPKNVGFGLSYVLPVIVLLLTAEKDKLILIENPESHIHPRGQAELGRLLTAATQTGAQLLVETHSDHIMNGVRVAVKENPETKDAVIIFFHDRITSNEEQYSKITPIKIDKQGELSTYPEHFLDEWSNQLFKLL